MISMFGPGFDSPQLHKQAENNNPERGFVFMETVESLLLKGIHKDKRTMRRMVSVFYLQDGNKWVT